MSPYKLGKTGTLQSYSGMVFNLWRGSGGGGVQNPVGIMLLILGGCLILPCLALLVIRSVSSLTAAMVGVGGGHTCDDVVSIKVGNVIGLSQDNGKAAWHNQYLCAHV